MKRIRLLCLFGVVSLVLSSPGLAHDLWLIPPASIPKGEPLTIRAVQGTKFAKGDRAPKPEGFAKAVAFGPDGTEFKLTPAGTDGDAGLLRLQSPPSGVLIVAVQTTAKTLTLDADAFNSYLVSDGLPHVFMQRARENALTKPGTERYSKSPKAVVRVGDGRGGDATKAVGLPLEIVPTKDPFAIAVGGALPVKVLFQGKPLADANLGWDHPGEGEFPSGTARTDAKGEALIPMAKAGLMTIRLTHMTRPKAAEYEWESFWTTLTFTHPGDGK